MPTKPFLDHSLSVYFGLSLYFDLRLYFHQMLNKYLTRLLSNLGVPKRALGNTSSVLAERCCGGVQGQVLMWRMMEKETSVLQSVEYCLSSLRSNMILILMSITVYYSLFFSVIEYIWFFISARQRSNAYILIFIFFLLYEYSHFQWLCRMKNEC